MIRMIDEAKSAGQALQSAKPAIHQPQGFKPTQPTISWDKTNPPT